MRTPRDVPEYLAYLWHCGDEHCDCYQARIIRQTTSDVTPRFSSWYRTTVLWSGTFVTGEGDGIPHQELVDTHNAMVEHWPEQASRIFWADSLR